MMYEDLNLKETLIDALERDDQTKAQAVVGGGGGMTLRRSKMEKYVKELESRVSSFATSQLPLSASPTQDLLT